MKTLRYITPLLVVSILLISGCDGGEVTETAEEAFMNQIAGAWQLNTADFDGKDVTASFSGLAVSISKNKTITVQNAVPPMWKASSTFTLTPDGTGFILNRDDGLIISVSQVTSAQLTVTFEYDAVAMGGRLGSVSGGFTFEFSSI